MEDRLYKEISDYIYFETGIVYSPSKKDLLGTKVKKISRKYEINNKKEFLNTIKKDQKIYNDFIHEITTHKTDFFRENNHFNFIKDELNFILDKNPNIMKHSSIRVWSAGCSTGEEPYTIAMVLKEIFPQNMKIKILATDISFDVLRIGVRGEYPHNLVQLIPKYYLTKYFIKNDLKFKVNEEIKQLVAFRQFNLAKDFPFKNQFDIIFCRNVMIYFDSDVRRRLVEKFYKNLVKGGFLIIGHSESLIDNRNLMKYVKPTVYLKE